MNVLFDDFGCYYIGFSVMKLNMVMHENSFIDIFKEDTATMIHEYVHYLQDISTVRGLSSIISQSEKLRLITSQFGNNNYYAEIPIRLSQIKEISSQVAFNDEVLTLENGDSYIENGRISHINDVCCETENMEILVDEYSDVAHSVAEGYQNVEFYYDDLDKTYRFGATCITESMAYLAEHILCKSPKRKNELPYNACELLCRFKFPDLEISAIVLLAICELSLMAENSGKLFYFILDDIAKKKLSFKSVGEFEKKYISIYRKYYKEMVRKNYKLIECIDFLYPSDITKSQLNTAQVNKKMKEKFKNGLIYRSMGLFISKAIEKNDLQIISGMFKDLGVPLIIDKNKDIYSDLNSDMIPLLMPLAAYNSFFSERESERSCFMYDFCKKQGMSIVNESNCKLTPWKQVNESKLCPYAVYLHMQGINPDKIILRSDCV